LRRRVGLVTTALLGALALAGCSGNQSRDDLQSAPTLAAAAPAASPPPAAKPAGTVLALPGNASAMVVDPASGTLAVAVERPAELVLFSLHDLTKAPVTIPLPGAVGNLSVEQPGGPVLAPVATANEVLAVPVTGGTPAVVKVAGGPTSAALFRGKLLVTVPKRNAIDEITGTKVTRTITGEVNPEQILVADGKTVMLDRIRSAVFDVNAVNGTVGAGLRAGQGATNAAVDGYGRVLVTDTRTGLLLAFSADPVLERQSVPAPGVPYGIAVDTTRNVAWVTATRTNEVIGYQLTGSQPVRKYRLPTVRQPDTVAVDPVSGRVFVASADGGGVQVMQP
jgi:DNA-binding beta-propeller fold protein YncE